MIRIREWVVNRMSLSETQSAENKGDDDGLHGEYLAAMVAHSGSVMSVSDSIGETCSHSLICFEFKRRPVHIDPSEDVQVVGQMNSTS
jgi:hypothetical protein